MPGWATQITLAGESAAQACPAMPAGQRWCSAGVFPPTADQYPDLREATSTSCSSPIAALSLNGPKPAAPWASASAAGFLGLRAMQHGNRAERLEREYNVDRIVDGAHR